MYLPELSYFVLQQLLVQRHATHRTAATATCARMFIKSALMPVPPLAEQRRIVDILSRAEGIVRLRRDAEKKAAELIPALFLDMFGDPATNPKGWPTCRIGELFDVKGGKRLPKGEPYSESPTAFRYIRGTDIKPDMVESGNLVYLTPETQAHIKRYWLKQAIRLSPLLGKLVSRHLFKMIWLALI